jgi:hypothetical protein
MEKGNIYDFVVKKPFTEKVKTVRKNKDGEEEEVTKNKTVKKEVKIVIKKPSRRLSNEASEQYSVELSSCVKKGILTKAMLTKKYADTGGALTESETAELLKKLQKSTELSNQLQLLESQKSSEEEKEKIKKEILQIRNEMIDIQSSVQTVYQHTADSIAERAMILWYVIQLTRYVEDGLAKPFFEGITYEDKKEDFFDKDESEDDFNNKVIETAMKVISFWFYAQNSDRKEIDEFLGKEEV